MILISKHRFNTLGRPQTTFPLLNEGQLIQHEFDISFQFDFNSSPNNQFIISGLNQLTMLNGSFADYGIMIGDSMDIDAVVVGGTNINQTAVVLSIVGNVLTFTTNIFTALEVNQLFPLGVNQEMYIVNNTRQVPESIDIFYNLVRNDSAGGVASLWDGEVNKFTCVLPLVNGTVDLIQIGDKSGGFFDNPACRLSLLGRIYSVSISYISWLGIEANNFTVPSWYTAAGCIKPYVKVIGFSEEGDPTATMIGTYTAQANSGWFNEAYNQGIDNFVLSDLVIQDIDNIVLPSLAPNKVNYVSFVVSNPLGVVSTDIQLSIGSFFDFSETKNNEFSRLQNQIGSFRDSAALSIDGVKNSKQCVISNLVVTTVGSTIEVVFRIEPNNPFLMYVQAQSESVPYRLAINVNRGAGKFDNVTKIISQNFWLFAGNQPILVDDKDAGFLNHAQTLTDAITEPYSGCTEDDMLFYQLIPLEKNRIYNNLKYTIDCIRDIDGEVVANLQTILFNFQGVPMVSGKYQININQNQNQFLDSADRNYLKYEIITGETPTFYNTQATLSLMANWRDWVSVINLLPDFYDFDLLQNGQSAEWVNYLRLMGYSLTFRYELNALTDSWYFERDITLLDYDQSDIMTSIIQVLNSDNVVVTAMVSNQIYKIRAIHTITDLVSTWGVGAWGWIGIRPTLGEPMKRISTAYAYTAQNLPLQPLPTETRAKITVVSPTVIWVECQINSNEIGQNVTFVSRINDAI